MGVEVGGVWVDRRDGRRVKVVEVDESFVWVRRINASGGRVPGTPSRSRVRIAGFVERYRPEEAAAVADAQGIGQEETA